MDEILSGTTKKEPELYKALGCDRSSSFEQITAEYRARVRQLHPDKLLEDSDNDKHEEYLRLQTAYTTLSDEQERKCYDAWLDSLLPLSYEEFKRNKDALKMSMHWITPKETPMLSSSDIEERHEPHGEDIASRWESGRFHSETIRKFRNYEL